MVISCFPGGCLIVNRRVYNHGNWQFTRGGCQAPKIDRIDEIKSARGSTGREASHVNLMTVRCMSSGVIVFGATAGINALAK